MSAAARDRAHTKDVELCLEIIATALDERAIDRREDAARRGNWRIAIGLRDALHALVSIIPGGAGIWQSLGRLFAGMRRVDELDALEDTDRERIVALARELAGRLEAHSCEDLVASRRVAGTSDNAVKPARLSAGAPVRQPVTPATPGVARRDVTTSAEVLAPVHG